MSGPSSGKPENYLDDPDILLRRARKEKAKEVIPTSAESPPAGRPPNFSWRPEASTSGSAAELTDRVVYASSFHSKSPDPAQQFHFSPINISPSAPEKTVIDLHFKKLLGHSRTPHPPGYLPQESSFQKQSNTTTTGIALTSDPTNTMSREEDSETIRLLRSQVENLELRTAELDQSRRETAELQKMVRDLLAERSQVQSPGNPATTSTVNLREPDQPSGSNSFSRYIHGTPTSPSPLPRNQREDRADERQQEGTVTNQASQPAPNVASHQRVSWAEDVPEAYTSARPRPAQSTPAVFTSRPAYPLPLATE